MRILAVFGLAALSVAAVPPPLAPVTPAVTRDCIDLRSIRSSRMTVANDYEVRVGRDWWRNTAECPAFSPDRIIVTRLFGNRMCRGDIADIVQATSRFTVGSCGLGNWAKLGPVAAAGGR